MTKTEAWIAAQIRECEPGGPRGRTGVEALVLALLFFEGKGTQVFGMTADRTSMPEADALRAACASAVRGWFDALGRSDVASQVRLYDFMTQRGLVVDLPVPPSVAAVQALEHERAQELARLGTPSEALPPVPGLASDLAELRALGERVSFERLERYVQFKGPPDMEAFVWLPDDWSAVASPELEPTFLPIAGGDGDYLGLLLDDGLLNGGLVPLVCYFHEHDPIYTWVFESCGTAVPVLQAAESKASSKSVSRGREHDAVNAFLEAKVDIDRAPTATVASTFVARNLAAQQVWREYDEKIRRARAAP